MLLVAAFCFLVALFHPASATNDLAWFKRIEEMSKSVAEMKTTLAGVAGAVNQLSHHDRERGCPADFKHIQEVNGCYKVVVENVNYDIAALSCKSLQRNAHLVIINDNREQFAVAKLLNSHTVTSYVWTAAQHIDMSKNSQFIWKTASPLDCSCAQKLLMRYTNWGPKEPNGGISEQCALMERHSGWRWHDVVCTRLQNYVCEIDL